MSDTTRVLVAEDNAVDRKVLGTIVRSAGYEVIEAVDGIEAIEKFEAEQPDIVLLDALMPGKDGFEVAEYIRSHASDTFIPIIFLTSLTAARELVRCLEAGGDDFLSKPYNKIILQAKLNAFQRMREMHQTMQSQRDEIAVHHAHLIKDQEAAKAVFDNVASVRQAKSPYIRQLLSPLAMFNGDVLLAGYTPADNLCLLLGDFTGHGLAAAIGAMPIADVFYSMTAKGFSLREVLRECNKKLYQILPAGTFCCATAVMIDFRRCTVEFWNGGLPSAYLRRAAVNEFVSLESKYLPLGVLPPDQFVDETLVVEAFPSDKLFLATDGVVEARNAEQEYFGFDRLEKIVREGDPGSIFDQVKSAVYSFMEDRDDDLTMVEVEIVSPEKLDIQRFKEADQGQPGPHDWSMTYELGPSSLREFNPLPVLQQILMEAPYLRSHSTSIYTVLSELYSNGLEHGVLGLDSKLKQSPEGFATYYEQRAKALDDIEGHVKFKFKSQFEDGQVALSIGVEDSGAGFDFASLQEKYQAQRAGSTQYHGRGIRLLWEICDEVAFQPPGNQVEVKMNWIERNE